MIQRYALADTAFQNNFQRSQEALYLLHGVLNRTVRLGVIGRWMFLHGMVQRSHREGFQSLFQHLNNGWSVVALEDYLVVP